MIQVCSRCGTRWNVRDRQREWCPRCRGALLPPAAPPPPAWTGPHTPGAAPPRLPPGYRWVAVRPGAPPPRRRPTRPLGPTPRYTTIPRWGLVEHFEPAEPTAAPVAGPTAAGVRTALTVTAVILGVAALLHAARYLLLLINRTRLLDPWVAAAGTWFPVAASVLAMFAVVSAAIVLTNWLIARRAAAYAHHGRQDPRSPRVLRAGCLIPLVNLLWAPVFVIELARLEDRVLRLRRAIVGWWLLWVLSTGVAVFAVATSFTVDPQGIADNTVTVTFGYLVSLATVLVLAELFNGFERAPVDRPARRWVVVPDAPRPEPAGERPEKPAGEPTETHGRDATEDTPVGVDSQGSNPAA